jgi:ankyrin repeat protein
LWLAAEWGDLKALQLLLSDGECAKSINNNIASALIAAALNGHIELVQLLLTHITDSEESNIGKQFALSQAAAGGHLAVCELLLNHGASLNIPDGIMPLHIAAEMGHTDICKLFIKHGADIDQTNINGLPPLYFAVRHDRVDACKLLLSFGADFDYVDPSYGSILCLVIASSNIELINDLLERGAKVNAPPGEITPLMIAALTGNPEIVKIFLEKGAEIHAVTTWGDTALSEACRSGSLDVVKLLLNNGADPNGNDKDPPLINAAELCSPSIIQLLIDSGAIVFSDDNVGYLSLRAAVRCGRIDNASKLLELNVPVEHTVIDQEEGSLLIAALDNCSNDDDVEMLELLLKSKLPLKGTDRNGNDALMFAVKHSSFNAVELLIKYGATIALKQTNKKGKNALHIAIAQLDSPSKYESFPIYPTLILASLLNLVKNNPDWHALQSTIIPTAEKTFTREVISTSLAWPLTKKDTSINDVVKTTIDFSALEKLIKSIIGGTVPLSREDIYRELSVVGIYSALSKEIYPYLTALPHIQFSLFGNTGDIHNKTISSFIAGLGVTLENIRIEHGEHWDPFEIDVDDNTIFMPLTQIANGQLTQLIDTSIATETTDLAQVFGTLSEICFNASFTAHSLPAIFPPYQAAPGAVTNALLAKGVYSVLASKIEPAWKKAWEKFTGTPLSSDAIHSNSSGSSSRTSSTTSLATLIDGNDMDDFFSSGDLSSEWIDELYVPPNLASFLESAQGQALLQAFRDELRLAFDQVGSNILELPKGSTEVPAEAAKIYSDLMFRQLHMLKQFIQAE